MVVTLVLEFLKKIPTGILSEASGGISCRDAMGNPTNPFPEVHGLSGTVRDPGDGQQKDDEDLARNNLRSVPKILENRINSHVNNKKNSSDAGT